MHRIAGQIKEHLQKANKIVLLSHADPDGDALGSINAMYEYLTILNKDVYIVSGTSITEHLSFLPHNNKINYNKEFLANEEIDTIVVLDSSDLKHTKLNEQLKNHSATIINIDHHATNGRYGHINMVIDTAAATTEVLYLFFRHNNIEINRTMANAILTGLITDTENFVNSATTALSLAIAGEMARLGANLKMIQKNTQCNKTIDTLKLWGTVLSRLEKDEAADIAYTYLTTNDLKKYSLDENSATGITNFLNNLKEAKIYAFFRETPENKIKISLRTTDNDTDVAKMVKSLGGGGHKKAAGVTINSSLKEAIEKILTIPKNNTIIDKNN